MNQKLIIRNLTEKVALIKSNREKLLHSSGESFNIFSLLQMEYDETSFHSRFIAALLNPKGLHGKKEFFLQKFLSVIGLPVIETSLLEQARVYTEEYIGPITENYLEGGLIDIVIKIPQDLVIVIENKINAGDQKHQLIRYKRRYPNAYLVYLTKFGNMPSQISTHNQLTKQQVIDFINDPKHLTVSYQKHILSWVEECYSEITRQALLRENLYQYITTIKKITNQLTDNSMSTEIVNAIINSNENLDGFFTLRKTDIIKGVERELLYKFIDGTIAIAKELGIEYDSANSNRTELGHKPGETQIAFKIPGTSFSIVYGFDLWRQDFSIAIGSTGDRDENIKQALSARLSDLLGPDENSPRWYYILYMCNSKHADEYLAVWDEGNFDVWGKINDGSVSERIGWYFKVLLDELNTLGLIPGFPH